MFVLKNIHVGELSGITIPADSGLSGPVTVIGSQVIGPASSGHVYVLRASSTNNSGTFNTYGTVWNSGPVNATTFASNFQTFFSGSPFPGTVDGDNFGQAVEDITGAHTMGVKLQLVELSTSLTMQIEHDSATPEWYIKFKINSIGSFSDNTANTRLNSHTSGAALRGIFFGGSSANNYDFAAADFIAGAGTLSGANSALKIRIK